MKKDKKVCLYVANKVKREIFIHTRRAGCRCTSSSSPEQILNLASKCLFSPDGNQPAGGQHTNVFLPWMLGKGRDSLPQPLKQNECWGITFTRKVQQWNSFALNWFIKNVIHSHHEPFYPWVDQSNGLSTKWGLLHMCWVMIFRVSWGLIFRVNVRVGGSSWYLGGEEWYAARLTKYENIWWWWGRKWNAGQANTPSESTNALTLCQEFFSLEMRCFFHCIHDQKEKHRTKTCRLSLSTIHRERNSIAIS